MENVIVEVCLDSCESAMEAERGGAERVELCDNLMEGGTTPSAGMIAQTRKNIKIGLQVIIRPRGGDFFYSPIEIEIMKHDIELCKMLGVDGVVIGILNNDGTINEEITKELIEIARPMNVTFHRAFDMTINPFEALETLINLGINRVLTSGQENSALEGLDLLTELNRKADGRIIIMPGCGITPRNYKKIVETSNVNEIHVVGNQTIESPMKYKNKNCFMGSELRSPEYTRVMTSSKVISSFING